MIHSPTNILIAGGTGFIGYYSALQFLAKGCAVTAVALEGELDLGTWFPREIIKRLKRICSEMPNGIIKRCVFKSKELLRPGVG